MNLKMALSHANGYRELGMFKESLSVLNSLTENEKSEKAVLVMFVAVNSDIQNWKKVLYFSKKLRLSYSNELEWWIQEAYALRRVKTKGIIDAEQLLLEAVIKFPEDAIVPYNLGCYRCVQGDLKEAVKYIHRAISLDPKYLDLAMTDSDLAVIRDFLVSTS